MEKILCIAIDDGPMCPQRNAVYRSTEDVGTEDCLRLNVYVPLRLNVYVPQMVIDI